MQRFVILSLLITMFAISGCKDKKKVVETEDLHAVQHQYTPDYYHDLFFGMTKEEFEKVKTKAKPMQSQFKDFRYVYLEKSGSDQVFETTYYVSRKSKDELKEGEKQVLYEMMLEYYSTTARDKAARELLGPHNHDEDNNEWMFETDEGFRIHCWTHLNKLIIVGKIAGTEWEEME